MKLTFEDIQNDNNLHNLIKLNFSSNFDYISVLLKMNLMLRFLNKLVNNCKTRIDNNTIIYFRRVNIGKFHKTDFIYLFIFVKLNMPKNISRMKFQQEEYFNPFPIPVILDQLK